jgi:hypothetical protein
LLEIGVVSSLFGIQRMIWCHCILDPRGLGASRLCSMIRISGWEVLCYIQILKIAYVIGRLLHLLSSKAAVLRAYLSYLGYIKLPQ